MLPVGRESITLTQKLLQLPAVRAETATLPRRQRLQGQGRGEEGGTGSLLLMSHQERGPREEGVDGVRDGAKMKKEKRSRGKMAHQGGEGGRLLQEEQRRQGRRWGRSRRGWSCLFRT